MRVRGIAFPSHNPTVRNLLALAGALILAMGSIGPSPVRAAVPTMTPEVVQDGLEHPWDIAFTPDGEMLVTERPGRVRVFASGAAGAPLLETIAIPSVQPEHEAGLMGIAVDTDYAANRFVYICASRSVGGDWVNQVLRYRVGSDLSWTAQTVILDGIVANRRHAGCALEMDGDGRLWISTGDASNDFLAQDPDSLNGKILRINRDGSIPADNPSAGSPVYSMGHRNPQGIAFQPGTGRVYASEHGPDRNDEINLIVPGGNYGWPCYSGFGDVYSTQSRCQPSTAYRAPAWASGLPTIASSALAFVDGEEWGDWDGQLFVSQLKEMDLRRFSLSADGTQATQEAIHFDGTWGRLRAATRGPAGQLYLSTSNGSDDKVIRISVAEPVVDRVQGVDRYDTAARVSAASADPDAPVAFVTSGIDFPDALTGGAAAAHLGGPVLLVTPNTVPDATAAELQRLVPRRIVVVGGPAAVSDEVLSALGALTTGDVVRWSGADRYETAARVARTAFAPGVAAVFLATGSSFADALAAVPAAAHLDGPLLLTGRNALPAVTAKALDDLNPRSIYIMGGTAAVSSAVATAVDQYTTGPVVRLAGSDRYATAAAASRLWARSSAAYVATGEAFPDGVAGGAAAGRQDVPLLLVRPDGMPTVTGQALIHLHPTRLTILGGSSAVGAAAAGDLADLLAIDP